MTNIKCNRLSCANNCNWECISYVIHLSDNGVCQDYIDGSIPLGSKVKVLCDYYYGKVGKVVGLLPFTIVVNFKGNCVNFYRKDLEIIKE